MLNIGALNSKPWCVTILIFKIEIVQKTHRERFGRTCYIVCTMAANYYWPPRWIFSDENINPKCIISRVAVRLIKTRKPIKVSGVRAEFRLLGQNQRNETLPPGLLYLCHSRNNVEYKTHSLITVTRKRGVPLFLYCRYVELEFWL